MCTKSLQKFLKCIRLAERRPVCVLLQDMLEQRSRQGFFPQSLTTIYPTATTHNSRLYTSLSTINPLLSIYPTVDNTPNVDHIPNCRQKKHCRLYTQLKSFFLQPLLLNNFDSTCRPLLVRWLSRGTADPGSVETTSHHIFLPSVLNTYN